MTGMNKTRLAAATLAAAAIVSIGPAAIAVAEPTTGTTSTTSTTTDSAPSVSTPAPSVSPNAKIGDGVWAPSHDEQLALIPVCSGPVATFKWLNANFTDHGNDIGRALRANLAGVIGILTFTAKPYDILKLAFTDVLQAPVYAVNDTLFHQPATVRDILTFCSVTNAKKN